MKILKRATKDGIKYGISKGSVEFIKPIYNSVEEMLQKDPFFTNNNTQKKEEQNEKM